MVFRGIAASRQLARTLAVLARVPLAEACSPTAASVAARAFLSGARNVLSKPSMSVRGPSLGPHGSLEGSYAAAVSRIAIERSILYAPLDVPSIVAPALLATEAAAAFGESTTEPRWCRGWPDAAVEPTDRELYFKVVLVDTGGNDAAGRSLAVSAAGSELRAWLRSKLSLGGRDASAREEDDSVDVEPRCLSCRWAPVQGYRVGVSTFLFGAVDSESGDGRSGTDRLQRCIHGCTGVIVVAPCDADGALIDHRDVLARVQAAVEALQPARQVAVPLVVLLVSPDGWREPRRDEHDIPHGPGVSIAVAAARLLRLSELPVAVVSQWAVVSAASDVLANGVAGVAGRSFTERVYAVVGAGASAETVCATARCGRAQGEGPPDYDSEPEYDDADGGSAGPAVAWRGNAAFALSTALQLVAGWAPPQPVRASAMWTNVAGEFGGLTFLCVFVRSGLPTVKSFVSGGRCPPVAVEGLPGCPPCRHCGDVGRFVLLGEMLLWPERHAQRDCSNSGRPL